VDTSNVLELGSGTGFIGILVASLQLHAPIPPFGRKMPSVYLTDVNSTVLVRGQNNVRLLCSKFEDVYLFSLNAQYAVDKSSSHPNIHYNSLDWLDSLSDQESLKSFFSKAKSDIVLGADIVCIGGRA